MENTLIKINLTKNEASHIKSKLSEIQYSPEGHDEYIFDIKNIAHACLPDRVLNILERQRTSKSPLPYFVIDNLPVDDSIFGSPLFTETGSLYKSGCLTENLICAIGSIIGEPYSINFEGRELVNNLTPQKDTKFDYTGLGSAVELDFHIENAALRFMPEGDYSPLGLLFLGVRHDPSARGPRTFVADSRLALKELTPECIAILRKNNFIINVPYRWRESINTDMENTDLCPIISGPDEYPRISAVFYPGMVMAANDKAKKAFEALYRAVRKVSIGLKITPGMLVYVDNRFALHSRESFDATYDENGRPYRWLQRLFIAANLWNLRNFEHLDGRVYFPAMIKSTAFEKRYEEATL